MSGRIIVLDEGTTSTRAILFDFKGTALASAQRDLTQYYPEPGWVEQDATEIWEKTLSCLLEMVAVAGGANKISAIGITNQRETIIFWDRMTGEPLARTIVWQDRRTADACAALKEAGNEQELQTKTGLLLDPYFSASKISWALKNWPQLEDAGDRLCCGTIESYLIFRLTGGFHVTDASNASRTALMNIHTGLWDQQLCDMFEVPMSILPEISDCIGAFGETRSDLTGTPIPICGAAGDQQAATIGQCCFAVGQTKATYGTGAFVLTNTGPAPMQSHNRLLSTILYQVAGKRIYALEGSVFVAGSLVQWLRDGLGLIANSDATEAMARSVPDAGGVIFVPGFSGLGAPWWRPDIAASISGISFATSKAHIVRAGLEAMAHQTHDLQRAFAADGAAWQDLRVDGGMIANNWIAQDLADILAIEVERPAFTETTALGAAMLAAVGTGAYTDLAAASVMRGPTTTFSPNIDENIRRARLAQWRDAMERILR